MSVVEEGGIGASRNVGTYLPEYTGSKFPKAVFKNVHVSSVSTHSIQLICYVLLHHSAGSSQRI